MVADVVTGASGTIRVQSVPVGHPYVAGALPDPRLDRVALLPDPVVDPSEPERWWPPRALDPTWLEAHADEIDVLHVHFGYDESAPEELEALAAVARRYGIALVVSVHDLHNPHQPDPEPHRARLGVLVGAADALITLTGGAADEVDRRWGRRPVVIPHPHLAAGRDRLPRGVGRVQRVGVHLKDLRPNTDVGTACDAMRVLADDHAVRGEIRVHREVFDAAHPRHVPGLRDRLDVLAAHERIDVLVHDRLDDTALADALAHLDVAVLPYRFGTHSGWLQLCRDLGVRVAAPDCGYYREQAEPAAVAEFVTGDTDSLVGAVRRLLEQPAPAPTTATVARRRRDRSRREHLKAYRAALAEVRG